MGVGRQKEGGERELAKRGRPLAVRRDEKGPIFQVEKIFLMPRLGFQVPKIAEFQV